MHSEFQENFHLLSLPEIFLIKDPSTWVYQDFNKAVNIVTSLAVVNDRAERGVSLIQDFNKTLAKEEEQLQFLLQVVSKHRQKFPNCKKSTLVTTMDSSDRC